MSRCKVLIIDDVPTTRQSLQSLLEARYEVVAVASVKEGLGHLEGAVCDVVLSSHTALVAGGRHVMRLKETVSAPVVVNDADVGGEQWSKAGEIGADDQIDAPLTIERATHVIERALKYNDLRNENRRLRKRLRDGNDARSIMGSSKAMQDVREKVRLIADTRAPVLITGESGVGKEVVARQIHRLSGRSDGAFAKISFAAISGTLLESELFGEEKTMADGTTRVLPGKLETASRGTILLDEISEMSAPLQTRLLRVMRDGEFERVGGTEPVHTNVRLIATTRTGLKAEIEKGRFRQDLFYRLSVVHIDVPPLRDHREDIPILVDHFIETLSQKNNKPPVRLTEAAVRKLSSAYWAGNVRELENTIERCVILTPGTTLDANDFQFDDDRDDRLSKMEQTFRRGSVREMEKLMIMHRLGEHAQNRTHTARTLDISVRTLRNKLRDYREANAADRGEALLPTKP